MSKRDNYSSRFSDWTTGRLKQFAVTLYECVYGTNSCYGVRDIQHLHGAEAELERRGYRRRTEVVYRKEVET